MPHEHRYEILNKIFAMSPRHLFKIQRISHTIWPMQNNDSIKIPKYIYYIWKDLQMTLYSTLHDALLFAQTLIFFQGSKFYLFEVYSLFNFSPLVVMRGRDFSNSAFSPETRNWHAMIFY